MSSNYIVTNCGGSTINKSAWVSGKVRDSKFMIVDADSTGFKLHIPSEEVRDVDIRAAAYELLSLLGINNAFIESCSEPGIAVEPSPDWMENPDNTTVMSVLDGYTVDVTSEFFSEVGSICKLMRA